jgi:ribosomal protein S18 acetylase RimI-like enzyme
MLQTDSITARPLLPTDEGFSYQVYASTRLDELSLVDWNDEQKETLLQMQFRAQSRHYQDAYPQATSQVIEWNGTPVGRLTVDRTERTTTLVDIALLPEFRRHGIGSLIIDRLQSENRKINLHVLKTNPALDLYRRLGFVVKDEDALYIEMEWVPEVK